MAKVGYATVVAATRKIIGEYPGLRLTIRQIYYRLVSPPYQLFPNTLRSYKNLVATLTKARERRDVDWRDIEDRRRRTLGGEEGYDSPESFVEAWLGALKSLDRYYARKRWSTQPRYVEVWVEKEALAALFEQASAPWSIIIFPTVGYSSLTMFMEASQRFRRLQAEKPIIILDFRDHDPSGVDMSRDVEDRLSRYGADITLKRVALTIDQVRELGLAPNPTKIADTRTPAYMAEYGNECWELDAYPPDKLSALVSDSVKAEIDMEAWEKVAGLEKEEKGWIESACGEAEDTINDLRTQLLDFLEDQKAE